MLQGFTRRIREELSDSVKNIYIIEVPNRKFLSFIGATKLEDAKDLWISKDEFHESGVQIIHQKCF
jgi:actin-related protein